MIKLTREEFNKIAEITANKLSGQNNSPELIRLIIIGEFNQYLFWRNVYE